MSIHNANRAGRAELVLEDYEGDEMESAIVDLLTDLRHLCDREKIQFDLCNARSQMHHRAETE